MRRPGAELRKPQRDLYNQLYRDIFFGIAELASTYHKQDEMNWEETLHDCIGYVSDEDETLVGTAYWRAIVFVEGADFFSSHYFIDTGRSPDTIIAEILKKAYNTARKLNNYGHIGRSDNDSLLDNIQRKAEYTR